MAKNSLGFNENNLLLPSLYCRLPKLTSGSSKSSVGGNENRKRKRINEEEVIMKSRTTYVPKRKSGGTNDKGVGTANSAIIS